MKKEEIFSMILTSSTRITSDLGRKKDLDSALIKFMACLSKGSGDGSAKNICGRRRLSCSEEEFPFLSLLQDAVWQKKKIVLRYKADEESKKRIVSPLELVAKGKIWYLVAKYEKEFRTFRVSRIIEANLGDSFERPKRFDLEKYWKDSALNFLSKIPSYPVHFKIRVLKFDFFKNI